MEGAEEGADVLQVEPLRPVRRADEVGEDDGHDLALLACRGNARQGLAAHALKRAPSGFCWPHAAQVVIAASLRGVDSGTDTGARAAARTASGPRRERYVAPPARSANFA